MIESLALTTLSWLATYLVHSTLLIGCVWAFTRGCTLDSLTRSLLWKLALVGGLFTASLQTGLGVRPALGVLALATPAEQPAPPSPPPPPPPSPGDAFPFADAQLRLVLAEPCGDGRCESLVVAVHEREPAWVAAIDRERQALVQVADEAEADGDDEEPVAAPVIAAAPAATGGPAPTGRESAALVLVGLFVLGAAASLVRLGYTARALRRTLYGRRTLGEGPLRERLVRLLVRARITREPVRLTLSPALRSPIALVSREIVVPPEALALEARQQEAMLAHELAHVIRRDPAWLVLAAVLEALLFIQPLNRLARKGMQEAAEELSDDWAVRHIGGGLHLARCLAEVAGWLERGPVDHRLASPMASEGGSMLVRRVRRLLDDGARERGRMATTWRVLLGVGLLCAVGWGAPGFAPSLAQASEAPTIPAPPAIPAPPTPTSSRAPMDPPPSPPAMPPMPPMPPVFATHSSAPVMIVGGDAAEPGKPSTARERRQARRAERLERRAEELRERSGTRARSAGPTIVVAGEGVELADGTAPVVRLNLPERTGCSDEAPAVIIARADMGAALADAAVHLDEPALRRIEQDARRAAKHAMKLNEKELRRLQRDAESMAKRAGTLGAADIRRIQEAARAAQRAGQDAARAAEREAGRIARDVERIQREAEREAGRIAREAERAAGREAGRIAREMERVGEDEAGRIAREMERVGEDEARRVEQEMERLGRELEREARDIERDVERGQEPDPEQLRRIEQKAREMAARAMRRAPRLPDGFELPELPEPPGRVEAPRAPTPPGGFVGPRPPRAPSPPGAVTGPRAPSPRGGFTDPPPPPGGLMGPPPPPPGGLMGPPPTPPGGFAGPQPPTPPGAAPRAPAPPGGLASPPGAASPAPRSGPPRAPRAPTPPRGRQAV